MGRAGPAIAGKRGRGGGQPQLRGRQSWWPPSGGLVLGGLLLYSALFLFAPWHLANVVAQTLVYHPQYIVVLGSLCGAWVLGNFLLCSVLFLCVSWHLAKVMAQTLGYHIQHIFVLGCLCNAWGGGAVEGWRGQGRRQQGCQRLV